MQGVPEKGWAEDVNDKVKIELLGHRVTFTAPGDTTPTIELTLQRGVALMGLSTSCTVRGWSGRAKAYAAAERWIRRNGYTDGG